jgi:hypothetical protein
MAASPRAWAPSWSGDLAAAALWLDAVAVLQRRQRGLLHSDHLPSWMHWLSKDLDADTGFTRVSGQGLPNAAHDR